MILGVYFQHIDVDPDYVKLRLIASNGIFCGSADLYDDTNALSEAATKLASFPLRSLDQCTLEFGTFQPGHAGGGVRMIFQCIDRAGHIRLQLNMTSDSKEGVPAESVSLLLAIEAASIDTFVQELRTMNESREATATLISS